MRKKGRYDILKFLIFSENISGPVLMNIQMSELMMSSPHNFSIYIVYEILKKFSL